MPTKIVHRQHQIPDAKDHGYMDPDAKNHRYMNPDANDHGYMNPDAKDHEYMDPDAKDHGYTDPDAKDYRYTDPDAKDNKTLVFSSHSESPHTVSFLDPVLTKTPVYLLLGVFLLSQNQSFTISKSRSQYGPKVKSQELEDGSEGCASETASVQMPSTHLKSQECRCTPAIPAEANRSLELTDQLV